MDRVGLFATLVAALGDKLTREKGTSILFDHQDNDPPESIFPRSEPAAENFLDICRLPAAQRKTAEVCGGSKFC